MFGAFFLFSLFIFRITTVFFPRKGKNICTMFNTIMKEHTNEGKDEVECRISVDNLVRLCRLFPLNFEKILLSKLS